MQDPVRAPGHTDLMVAPEEIDAFLEASPLPTEVWYRYRDVRYAPPTDEYGDAYGVGRFELVLDSLPVRKRTAKGVWLDWYGTGRFVLLSSRKQFACSTIEEARRSFRARKQKQAGIYRARLRDAEKALDLIEALLNPAELG